VHDPPRILIVDDNATNRDILATRLAAQGYALCEAADGEAAITAGHMNLLHQANGQRIEKFVWIEAVIAGILR
jgi:CheY-like chemotaxis protein